MHFSEEYELIDFGDERKLERFGPYLIDRPAPAAAGKPVRAPQLWQDVAARFTRRARSEGTWHNTGLPEQWTIACTGFRLQLRPTPFGHLGVFPEQAENWRWIGQQVKRARRPLKILNLFGYTGGSSLAAAAAGAQVVHVDAARNMVAWARANADESGLGDAPIRWITDDASRFVQRELRRGNQYDAVILDPPSYGHGPQGEVWKIARDLHGLLAGCAALTKSHRAFLLLTCHSSGFGPAEAEAILADAVFGHCGEPAAARKLYLETAGGRRLFSGVVARWPA